MLQRMTNFMRKLGFLVGRLVSLGINSKEVKFNCKHNRNYSRIEASIITVFQCSLSRSELSLKCFNRANIYFLNVLRRM